MNKREYCESRESIAYYSGLNGLEIKGIEYGIRKEKARRRKLLSLYPLTRCKRLYAMKHGHKGLQIAFVISR